MSKNAPPTLAVTIDNFDSATAHFPTTRLELSRDLNQQPKPRQTATLPLKSCLLKDEQTDSRTTEQLLVAPVGLTELGRAMLHSRSRNLESICVHRVQAALHHLQA